MTKTNVQSIPSNSQHHDTPNNKTHVIKFRVTAEKKASLELTCKLLNLSLSTFIRRAIQEDKLPRLISAQSLGCYPINRAIQEDKPWEPMEENTLADSIAVGVPRNADKALTAIRESDGIVVNVSDQEIMAAQQLLGRTCGVFGEPAGVTGAAGVKKLCEQGVIGKDDTVVSVVTGNGLKDVANAIKAAGEPISIPSDMDRLLVAFAEKGITVE